MQDLTEIYLRCMQDRTEMEERNVAPKDVSEIAVEGRDSSRSGIVGLAGYARVGKDAVRKTLESVGFSGSAFADKLREFASMQNDHIEEAGQRYADLIRSHGYEGAKAAYPIGIRKYLVAIGQAGRDVLGENIWIDAALSNRFENVDKEPGYAEENEDRDDDDDYNYYEASTGWSFDSSRPEVRFATSLNGFIPEAGQRLVSLLEAHLVRDARDGTMRFAAAYVSRIRRSGKMLFGPDVWNPTLRASASVSDLQNRNGVGSCASESRRCMSDVRQPNESETILHRGGEVWMIIRPDVNPADDTERSTVPLLRFNRVIYNNGTLEELELDALLALENAERDKARGTTPVAENMMERYGVPRVNLSNPGCPLYSKGMVYVD